MEIKKGHVVAAWTVTAFAILSVLTAGIAALWIPGDIGRNLGNTAVIMIIPIIAMVVASGVITDKYNSDKAIWRRVHELENDLNVQERNKANLESKLRFLQESKAENPPQDKPLAYRPVKW